MIYILTLHGFIDPLVIIAIQIVKFQNGQFRGLPHLNCVYILQIKVLLPQSQV